MKLTKFGTVRCYKPRTGQGWITPDDGTRDVRVYPVAVNDAGLGQLAIGQTVGFTVSGRRPHAVDLWATWSNR